MAKGAIRRTNTLGICVTVSAFLKHVLATPLYARTRPPAPSLMPPKYLLVFCGGGFRNGEMSFINQIQQTEVFEVGASTPFHPPSFLVPSSVPSLLPSFRTLSPPPSRPPNPHSRWQRGWAVLPSPQARRRPNCVLRLALFFEGGEIG